MTTPSSSPPACEANYDGFVTPIEPNRHSRVTKPGQVCDIRPPATAARIARSFAGTWRSLRHIAIHSESTVMKTSTKIAAALLAVLMLASCGNTIRGVGKDTSNAVDATEDAAKDVAN
jgi:entericidin B